MLLPCGVWACSSRLRSKCISVYSYCKTKRFNSIFMTCRLASRATSGLCLQLQSAAAAVRLYAAHAHLHLCRPIILHHPLLPLRRYRHRRGGHPGIHKLPAHCTRSRCSRLLPIEAAHAIPRRFNSSLGINISTAQSCPSHLLLLLPPPPAVRRSVAAYRLPLAIGTFLS